VHFASNLWPKKQFSYSNISKILFGLSGNWTIDWMKMKIASKNILMENMEDTAVFHVHWVHFVRTLRKMLLKLFLLLCLSSVTNTAPDTWFSCFKRTAAPKTAIEMCFAHCLNLVQPKSSACYFNSSYIIRKWNLGEYFKM